MTKDKIDKLDLIKIKNICDRNTVEKVKRVKENICKLYT